MSVHYKFKSGKDAHTITFDSLHISVGELKKAIMQQRKIGKSADLDLQITNAQTKEVYDSDSILIPKNTSVIVARVPVANVKKNWNKNDSNSKNDNSHSLVEEKVIKNVKVDGSEDDKIKEMLTQSTKDYDPSKYARGKGPMGPLPPNYTCYRCGNPGHYIKHCPTNSIDVKRSTGIPRSFMIPAKADQKGAMITASGEYAVPIIDHDAYKEIKKEKPPFSSTENETELPKIEIPEDLKCSLCQYLLQDAVLIPCCGNSFCDECIRSLLLDSDNHECPSCNETNVSPDTLIPNRYLRLSVAKFKNESGFGVAVPSEEKKADTESVDVKEDKVEVVSSEEKENLISKESDSSNHSETVSADQKTEQEESSKKDLNEPDSDVKLDNSQSKKVIIKENVELKTETEVNESAKSEDSVVKDEEHTMIPNVVPTIDSSNYATMNPMLTPNLQPPFALSYNNGVGRYRNQIRVRSSGQINMFGRNPGQMIIPRNNYGQSRPLLPHEPAFFNDAMPSFQPMGLSLPYGYSHTRNPMFDNMYNLTSRGNQLNPLMSYQNSLNSLGPVNGHTLSVIDSDNTYYPYKYDDYDDKIERFNRQLESGSRSRRYVRKYSRSRSKSPHSKSRSRSVSSTSSRSSSRSRKSSRSRRHSPSRYIRREKSRSRSSHRYHKASSYSHHRRSHSHSKYEKRSIDRVRERNDRDKKSYKSLKREKESVEHTIRKNEKIIDGNKEDKPDVFEDNSANNSNNILVIDSKNKDFPMEDAKDLPENDNLTDVPMLDLQESDGKQLKNEDKELKEAKEKRKEKSSKSKHSRSRSRSRSSSPPSDSSVKASSSKKKSKKSSKESSKSNVSEKPSSSYKSKSKSGTKSKDHKTKTSKVSSEAKHSKDKVDKKKKSKESSSRSKEKSNNVKIDLEENESVQCTGGHTLPKESDNLSLSENIKEDINKSEEMEIKIQEDYSDFEFADSKYDKEYQKDTETNHNSNKENFDKALDTKANELKMNEDPNAKSNSVKSVNKPLLSFTIERKTKIASKLTYKDKEKDNKEDKGRDRDKSKERNREKDKSSKGSKDRHKDRSSHKSDSHSSKSSKSKDKRKEHSHKSKRSHRKSKSRSSSVSPRKKLKSEIDSSSKHKSSRSHRK